MECKACGKEKDLRIGTCFDCAEAESIIAEGFDMYDNGPEKEGVPAETPMQKLKFLIKKGWEYTGKIKK